MHVLIFILENFFFLRIEKVMTVFLISDKMFLKLESLICVLNVRINRTYFLLSIFVCGLGLGRHVYVGTPPTLGIAN